MTNRRERRGLVGLVRMTGRTVVLLSLFASPAVAQSLTVRAATSESAAPVVGAVVYLTESVGGVTTSALSDQRGMAVFRNLPGGVYRIRVEMIGMDSAEEAVGTIEEGANLTRTIRMTARPIALEGLEVDLAGDRCAVRPMEDGELVAQLWDEARKALAATSVTSSKQRYYYETMWYERHLERGTETVQSERSERRDGYMTTPYESRPPQDLMSNGFVQRIDGEELFFAPDAAALLSDVFLDAHCFQLVASHPEAQGVVGLGFRPVGDRRSVPDIAGTMWLNVATAELQTLEYVYQYLEPERTAPEVGGRVDFERLPEGTWIVREWWIRMPAMRVQTDFSGRSLRSIHAFKQTGGLVVGLRAAPTANPLRATSSTGVAGQVLDSLGTPASGIRVSAVGSNQEIYTSPDGEFGITGLVEGRYSIRISDPMLDVIAYEAEPSLVDVVSGEMAYLEHQLPSVEQVLVERCGGVHQSIELAVVGGRVTDPSGLPVPDATVRIVWDLYDFSGVPKGRTARDIRELPQTLEVTTDADGVFTLCDVPRRRPLRLHAELGEVLSAEVELSLHETEAGALRVIVLGGNGSVR